HPRLHRPGRPPRALLRPRAGRVFGGGHRRAGVAHLPPVDDHPAPGALADALRSADRVRAQPMTDETETGAAEDQVAPEDEYARRLGVVEAIRTAGGDPYPVRFDRDRTAQSLHDEFDALEPGSETGVTVRVAGRLLLIRRQGKLVFATLRDGTAAIQLFVSQGEVGEEALAEFARLDLGDWVGIEGEVMTTRRGELSVKVRS